MAKPRPRTKPSKPAKPARGKKAPKRKPAKPAKAKKAPKAKKASKPDARPVPPLGQPQEGAIANTTRAQRSAPAKQLALPDTEQVRDETMEDHYAHLVAEKEAKAAANRRIHELEASIQKRFTEFHDADPKDPRAKAYTVDCGEVLRPDLVPRLLIQRAPSEGKKARDKAGVDANAIAAAATPEDGDSDDDDDDADDNEGGDE